MSIQEETKKKMHQCIEFYKQELRNIRAGRATAALIEGVLIEAYNSQMKLKELGNISSPESRQLLITPFDGSLAGPISKGIEKANLGLRSSVEGKTVRVFFPELTQERRKDLITQCHKKREDCKISIRSVRRDVNEFLKKQKAASIITEDDIKREEKHIQELTDKFCKEADDACVEKEKEISTI